MQTLEADQVTSVRVPVTIEVDSTGYDKIVALIPGEEPGATKFQDFMNQLCADFVGGGLMLSPEDMLRIHDYKADAGPDDLIQAIAESSGMEEGQMIAKWAVDPSYWEPLRLAAETQGITVEDLVQNLMNYAINGGWFFDLSPMPKQVLMTQEDFADLEKIMDKKEFTGADIVAFLRKAVDGPTLDDLFPAEEQAAIPAAVGA